MEICSNRHYVSISCTILIDSFALEGNSGNSVNGVNNGNNANQLSNIDNSMFNLSNNLSNLSINKEDFLTRSNSEKKHEKKYEKN